MTPTELDAAEKRMRQKWYDLVMEEQKGAGLQTLERMYNAYMLAVEEYNHCTETYQHTQHLQQKQAVSVPSEWRRSEEKRKAS